MKQTILNIIISRDIHKRKNGEIGVLVHSRMEKQLSDGQVVPYRSYCSYEIKPAEEYPAELRKLRHFKQQYRTSLVERRAA